MRMMSAATAVIILVLLLVMALALAGFAGAVYAEDCEEVDEKELEREDIKKVITDPVTYAIEDNKITLYWGEKPTGGYSIDIADMLFQEGTLKVFYALTYPAPGEPVIMVITYPCDSAALPVEAGEIVEVVLVEIDKSFLSQRERHHLHRFALDKEKDNLEEFDQSRVIVKGRVLQSDTPLLLKEGRILVPVRAISEALGAEVSWDDERALVRIVKGDDVVHLFIGETKFYLNGKTREMDSFAALYNNHTVVPLRFVAEALGEEVSYCQKTGLVTIGQ